MTINRRSPGLLTATLTVAAVLTACGGAGSPTRSGAPNGDASPTVSAPAEAHNAADVAFAQGMIPHHQQALDMAGLAAQKATEPKVKDLADKIAKAQKPEIDTMSTWLAAWGRPVPAASAMDHGDHGSLPGREGMMTEQEMDRLPSASGAEFDRMWLELMIRHHEGAVTMATTELQQGTYPAATGLARAIISAQQTEITEMRGLLGRR